MEKKRLNYFVVQRGGTSQQTYLSTCKTQSDNTCRSLSRHGVLSPRVTSQLRNDDLRCLIRPASTNSQVDATHRKFAKPELTCVRTSARWPNGFASRRNAYYCDELVSTCAGWPNGKKIASTCVQIWARPKSAQVDESGQTKRKCVDLRVRSARALY